ncbi:hypothetical protein UFOVP1596_9 [uncultured Caudovirales phage]|uniref:Uncharacterized protein n=1 Tax=uncultured Caudovirales phage TaxID=2100421 RepID=A0A6J5SUX5_9CAUD|nr:hypothetical protein UFOVP1596_9 [uncultured Caudovirales phage]
MAKGYTFAQLSAAVKRLAGTWNKDFVEMVTCEVTAVDASARTCDVVQVGGRADTPILGVNLQAENNDGLLQIPTIGSQVKVALSVHNDPFVIAFGDVDEVYIRFQTAGKIQLGDGTLDGLVKVNSLVTRLNNLEKKVNDIVSKFATHVHSGVTTGGGVSGTTATPVVGSLTPTVKADIENSKIKQGV